MGRFRVSEILNQVQNDSLESARANFRAFGTRAFIPTLTGGVFRPMLIKERLMELEDIEYWKSLINIGLTKIFILKILSMGPNHGYGILKELQSLTQGCCSPTFGTIYPILKSLTREGYAKVKESKQLKGAQKRRVYTLTPLGVKAYYVALDAWRTTIPYIHRAIESGNVDIKRKGVSGNA